MEIFQQTMETTIHGHQIHHNLLLSSFLKEIISNLGDFNGAFAEQMIGAPKGSNFSFKTPVV